MTPTVFNLYASHVRGRKTNTSYPFPVEISDVDDLKKVAAYDHTGGRFRDYRKKNGEVVTAHRSKDTFIETNVGMFDTDNDAENPFDPDIPPEEWKSPADIDMSSFYNMSESDQKLLDLVLNDRACRILNTTDSNGMFDAFFGY